MTIEKQKEVANYFLKKLQDRDYRCMVAGGAPRDWYIGRTAKDIDVFVDTDFTHTELEDIVGLQVTDLTLPPEYEGNPNINSVFETKYFGQTARLSLLPHLGHSACFTNWAIASFIHIV